ncbi:hypothetical protein GNIT_2135 [Glaciecola nitratireducens FR1064]|uniref:Uncharacterized protein n=1 Tax=Glaciecola nitratireducens (strain JCM 12485 / KCTC 12276 / FR1064) TaxID=1085623 RepID=G4QH55_GLANF|nr:hypothetical protein GNIT_2135 [Glaciecola nitratireducens FR1064]
MGSQHSENWRLLPQWQFMYISITNVCACKILKLIDLF